MFVVTVNVLTLIKPGAHRGGVVPALLFTILRHSQTQTDEVRGQHLRDFKFLRLCQTERRTVLAERVVSLIIEPGGVAKFECTAYVLGNPGEKLVQYGGILLE